MRILPFPHALPQERQIQLSVALKNGSHNNDRPVCWIYAAPLAESAEVEIDGSEIHDFCWIGVADAVAQHEAGQLGMLPPTYITLCSLLRYPNTAAMTEAETQRSPHEVFPIFTKDDGAVAVLFEGDAEYAPEDHVSADARHRAVMHGTNWVYLHENVAAQYPAFVSNET